MTRREVPLDAGEIFAALARWEVDYLVIGGLAVQVHGHVRTTQDADLLPEPGSANLERLAAALCELAARPAGEPIPPPGWALDGEMISGTAILRLDTDAGGVDVHRQPPGKRQYSELRAHAVRVELGGIALAVVGLDDLIAMKLAAGRPIDRGDVLALTDPLDE